MTRLEEILEVMLDVFESEGFEDTDENRLAFLTGIRDVWSADTDDNPEKTAYMLELTLAIALLQIDIAFPGTEEVI